MKHLLQSLLLCVAFSTALTSAFANEVTIDWNFNGGYAAEACVTFQGTGTGVGTLASSSSSDGQNYSIEIDATAGKLFMRGSDAQVNATTIIKVPVVTTNDVVTFKNYSDKTYACAGNIGGKTFTKEDLTYDYKATSVDVAAGFATVTITENGYMLGVSVVHADADAAPIVLENQATVAKFAFNLGTEGQKADFGECADYFLNSKITYGSNLTLFGKKDSLTTFVTTDQESAAGETNAIRFLIQPKFGFTFTPSKVKFQSTRYGTDNGTLDISWQNVDGTTKSLATAQKPNRNNGNPPYTIFSYDVDGAVVGEGACGLLVNLYGLQATKELGFVNIIIEGVLNGTEKEVPMLGSFSANGVDYVADNVFEASGDSYVATIELSKKETMISAVNAVANVAAITGTVGTIAYEGDATACTVIIPVTLGEISINYVINFVQKPDFTITYIDTDKKTVLGTQQVEKDAQIGEFAVDYAAATAAEGYKVRGWFYKTAGGQKYATTDVITGNVSLYAVATEIETSSEYKKYTFALNDTYFYVEDHEAFCPTEGSACKFHDAQHGWSFYNGDVVEVLVGSKATISIALCKYGSATNIVIKKGDEVLATLAGKSETDGDVVVYNYEGEPGKLTLNFEATGEMYIHSVKIVNTANVNYESKGQWYFVKAGDASSFLDVLDVVNGANASKTAPRAYIFLPNGTYDLGETVLTTISAHNVSLIGESMENTIIVNAPDKSVEGIGTTATLLNSGSNLYMQDLTIKNDLDYYNSGSAGRAVCLHDKGSNTICKNVKMVSYQDTYYSNAAKSFYWETSELQGTVDFLCGDGDVVYNNCDIVVRPRQADGKGECTIAAPYISSSCKWGYVMLNCNIVNQAQKFNLGRSWGGTSRLAYINTVFTDDAATKIVSNRFNTSGMNVAAYKFCEYNSVDESGAVVSPASNTLTFTHATGNYTYETILTADSASAFTLANIYPTWSPADSAAQVEVAEVSLKDGVASWAAVDGAIAYAVYVDGVLADIITENSYSAAGATTVEVRAANGRGGFGEKKSQASGITPVSIINADADVLAIEYYNLAGQKFATPQRGVNIIRTLYTNGDSKSEKVIVK
ncbi:MAG: pectin esterase [Bacteroidales bacterium]|nr:pectin esterase [Bacteroidales bacterium]